MREEERRAAMREDEAEWLYYASLERDTYDEPGQCPECRVEIWGGDDLDVCPNCGYKPSDDDEQRKAGGDA